MAKNKKSVLFSWAEKSGAFIFALLLFASSVPVYVSAEPKVKAQSAVVINADTGEILFAKNENDKKYPASCTKIMTALLAVRYGDENDCYAREISMSHNAIWGIDRDSSHIALDVDEVVTYDQLLYGMMLASANECAMELAETVGGSVEAFASLMNAEAERLGAKNTNFVNPHGLFDENHRTTAYDMALIMREAVKSDKFVELISTLQYSIPPTNKQKETRIFNNTHKMLSGRECYYSSVVGGKTGWIPQSGNNLITYAEQSDIRLIVVDFGNTSAVSCCHDTANLLDYFFDNYAIANVNPADYGDTSEVELECAGVIEASCETSVKVLMEKAENAEESLRAGVTMLFVEESGLSLPIEQGTLVGHFRLSLDGRLLGEAPVYSAKTVYVRSDEEIRDNVPSGSIVKKDKGTFGKILTVCIFVAAAVLILLGILAVIALCIRRRNIRYANRRRMTRSRQNVQKKTESEVPYDIKKRRY